ncbi:MAG: amidohydrolase [Pseudomonadota bacterium]
MTANPKLRVSLVQTDLIWHDPAANLEQLAAQIAPLAKQTDLVVLPEMFTSGFTVHPETVASDHSAVQWLLDQSARLGAAITGSVACKIEPETVDAEAPEAPGFVNRLLFVSPDGKVSHYDKVHLFRMGDEHQRYRAGKHKQIVHYRGWRLQLTICYDLRFPVFCRNQNNYDVMICVANWPKSRRHHWRTLLHARAIENQAYVVGVNRVGVDGNHLQYSGDSMLIDPLGEALIDEPGKWVKTATLSHDQLQGYRQRFPAWKDADSFYLETI